MNIIFGKEQADTLADKYTVLELDTFKFKQSGMVVTAYCTVENIPITELTETSNLKALHAMLIENYANQQWNLCEQTIEKLVGKWGGEVDSFYESVRSRVDQLKHLPPDDTWSSVIPKT